MNEIDHEYTHDMVCPYCGYEDMDAWEFDSNNGTVECGDCEKEFEYERIIDIRYSTKKIINPTEATK
jgi:transcription elongation factor Elf1